MPRSAPDGKPWRILVTGGRGWVDHRPVARGISGWLESQGTSIGGAWPFPVVVHGDCETGADQHAHSAATTWGWTPEPHPAMWQWHSPDCRTDMCTRRRSNGDLYCLYAGHRRNQLMVNLGAHVCLAFPTARSTGTWDCVKRAEAAGIPVIIKKEEPHG